MIAPWTQAQVGRRRFDPKKFRAIDNEIFSRLAAIEQCIMAVAVEFIDAQVSLIKIRQTSTTDLAWPDTLAPVGLLLTKSLMHLCVMSA